MIPGRTAVCWVGRLRCHIYQYQGVKKYTAIFTLTGGIASSGKIMRTSTPRARMIIVQLVVLNFMIFSVRWTQTVSQDPHEQAGWSGVIKLQARGR